MLSFIHKKCQGINTQVVLLGKLLSLDYAKSIITLLMTAAVKQSTWGSVRTWEGPHSTVARVCCDSAEEQNHQVSVINRDLNWKSKAVTEKRGAEGLHGKWVLWELSPQNGDCSRIAARCACFYFLPYFLQTKVIQETVNQRFNGPLISHLGIRRNENWPIQNTSICVSEHTGI